MAAMALPVSALALLLCRAPTYDVWAWLVWGREIAHLDLSTVRGPAWKPLPVFVATALTPFGSAMPALWLVVARVGGLLAVGAAARLAWRAAGPFAAAGAAAGLLSTNLWVGYLLPHGMSEPMLAGFVLWAVDRHVDGRRGQAYWLLVGAALLRPEIWPFLGLYALWLWRQGSVRLPELAAGLATVPLAWFVPQYFGSHHPFRLGQGQAAPDGPLTHRYPGVASLQQLGPDLLLWVKVGAAAGVVYAVAARDRLLLAVTAGGLTWAAIVAVMAQVRVGSGVSRYLVVTHAAAAVLAGVGWVKGVAYVRDRLVALTGAGGPLAGRWLLLPGVAVAGVIGVFSAFHYADRLRPKLGEVRHQEYVYEALPRAVEAAGGRQAILSCGRPWADPLQVTLVAWEFHLHQAAVRSNPLPGPPPETFRGPMLRTRNRVNDPVSPDLFTFFQWSELGRGTAGDTTWTVVTPCA